MLGKKDKKCKLPIQRDNIIAENPENHYDFDDEEIGRGKFSVVKKVTHKTTKEKYAAKIIKFDNETLKFAIREYDLMNKQDMRDNKHVPKMHEAYIVRKYLIIIMTLYDHDSLLEFFTKRKSALTEQEVATLIKQLCTILHSLHQKNIVHLDLRPTNIRLKSLTEVYLLDFNSARHLANKKAGEVVDVIGDTEFCAPEMLSFDRVQPQSDMWSVAVIMFILLFGNSPFYYEDEAHVSYHVEKVLYEKVMQVQNGFEETTPEAISFIKAIFKRGPEMRMTAEAALQHKWLQDDYKYKRQAHAMDTCVVHTIFETDKRLKEEEEEEYIEASMVFKTFEEEEHISPEEESSEEEC